MELEKYCQDGNLAALQAYCNRANVTAAQVREFHALQRVCEDGHLEVARWLQQTYQLTEADARDKCNYALRWACSNGYLEVARWLQQTFQLTDADARAVGNFALHWTCFNGHLEVVRWLQQTFQLSAADAQASNNWTLRMVCERGHLGILHWLQRTWGIPPDALASISHTPKTAACAAYLRGLHALRWSPRAHADFPLPARRLALLLLLVNQRLAHKPGTLPSLPPELWHHLLSYLPARW